MKLSELPVPLHLSARVSPVAGSGELSEGPVTVRSSLYPEEYDLIRDGSLMTVSLQNRGDQDALDFALSTGRASLAWLESEADDGSAELKLALFNGELAEMGVVDVGLDEHALEAARRAFGKNRATREDLIDLLTENCILTLGHGVDDTYFLFIAGPVADAEFEAAQTSLDGKVGAEQLVPPEQRSFCIQGNGVRLAVAKKQKSRDEKIFLAARLTNARAGQRDNAIRLARARLSFSDYTRTGQIRAMASGQMAILLSQKSSYLRKWDEYGEAEGRVLLGRARAIGVMKYTNFEPCSEGMTLFLDRPVPKGLSSGDELEITQTEPPYLKDPSMEWKEFCAILEETSKIEWAQRKASSGASENEIIDRMAERATVLAVSEHSITVNLRTTLPGPEAGLIFVFSMSGERAQIERRMEARRRVVEGRSANPILGMLIEEDGDVPEMGRPPTVPALTNFVKSKVFPRNPPTQMQEEAIRVALNTPDIALIQGPPGTGKTTVIAAILERLNEMSDKRKNIRGQVLLSGFQHDAVENLMLRLTINSLPVPKFGRRSSDGHESAGDLAAERLRQWGEGVAVRLRERNPALAASEQERDMVLLCHQYALAPSLEHAIHMLDAALQFPRTVINETLALRLIGLKELLEDERRSQGEDGSVVIEIIRALRTSPDAFQDDGPERAADLLTTLPNSMSAEQQALLKKAVCWQQPDIPPFLADLRPLKRDLMERFSPRPIFRVEKAREDVIRLIAEVVTQIQQRGVSSADKAAVVLAEFLAGLESDPCAIEQAVTDYSYAFAATCQGSAGNSIKLAKCRASCGSASEQPSYATVIVDEAARVGPRDLLVPMVQAQRRIILVGDHRQLSHLIDEEVVRALETSETGLGESGGASEDDLIKRSMFQYLFKRLGDLEKKDGIRRRVTLDQQFRMHPMLGEFVSRNFYARYGEGFASPLPENLFFHSLQDSNGASAMWLDIPASKGREEQRGTSWCRRAEANRIAEQLHKWIDTPEGQHLSFGIITFYKAQTDIIKAELSKYGYTYRDADGSWKISKAYAFLPAKGNGLPEERLRIGTVDSFQGMEFDVVFLSMVRSRGSRAPQSEPEIDNSEIEKQGRRLFGRLLSENLVCVSMSRQKRLLVVAGDSQMVMNRIAEKSVPGLASFYQLCREKGAIL